MIRKVIEIDEELCTGCGQCVPSCAEGAIEIINNKARLIADKYCDGLGACLGECPEGALKIVERETEEFDAQAVHELLESQKQDLLTKKKETLPCGCPSTKLHSFGISGHMKSAPPYESHSALSHWPVKIRLIPPTAPFLKGADLLIAADCTPVASGSFHRDYMEGKVVMLGCPKFDDIDFYREKIVEIFKKAHIRSITTVSMEVPCCSALSILVKEARKQAGMAIPLEEIVISIRGDILKKEEVAA